MAKKVKTADLISGNYTLDTSPNESVVKPLEIIPIPGYSTKDYEDYIDEPFNVYTDDINRLRADGQGVLSKAFNMGAGGWTKGLLTGIQDVSYLVDIDNMVGSMLGLEKVESNFVADAMIEGKEWLDEKLPIYKRDPSNGLDFSDPSTYFSLGESVVESAMGFGTAGLATGGAVSALSGLTKANKAYKAFQGTSKLLEAVYGAEKAAPKIARLTNFLTQGGKERLISGALSNMAEGRYMADELIKSNTQVLKDNAPAISTDDQARIIAFDKLSRPLIYDENGQVNDPEFEAEVAKVKEESLNEYKNYMEKGIRKADEEAKDLMLLNSVFMLQDASTMRSMFRGTNAVRNMVKDKAFKRLINSATRKAVIKEGLKDASGEAIEEISQGLIQREQEYDFTTGMNISSNENTSLLNRTLNNVLDPNVLVEGAMGFLGGPIQHSLMNFNTRVLGMNNKKEEALLRDRQSQQTDKNKSFVENSLNPYFKNVKRKEKALLDNDLDAVKDIDTEMFSNIVFNNLSQGTIEDFEDKLKELKNIPYESEIDKETGEVKVKGAKEMGFDENYKEQIDNALELIPQHENTYLDMKFTESPKIMKNVSKSIKDPELAKAVHDVLFNTMFKAKVNQNYINKELDIINTKIQNLNNNSVNTNLEFINHELKFLNKQKEALLNSAGIETIKIKKANELANEINKIKRDIENLTNTPESVIPLVYSDRYMFASELLEGLQSNDPNIKKESVEKLARSASVKNEVLLDNLQYLDGTNEAIKKDSELLSEELNNNPTEEILQKAENLSKIYEDIITANKELAKQQDYANNKDNQSSKDAKVSFSNTLNNKLANLKGEQNTIGAFDPKYKLNLDKIDKEYNSKIKSLEKQQEELKEKLKENPEKELDLEIIQEIAKLINRKTELETTKLISEDFEKYIKLGSVQSKMAENTKQVKDKVDAEKEKDIKNENSTESVVTPPETKKENPNTNTEEKESTNPFEGNRYKYNGGRTPAVGTIKQLKSGKFKFMSDDGTNIKVTLDPNNPDQMASFEEIETDSKKIKKKEEILNNSGKDSQGNEGKNKAKELEKDKFILASNKGYIQDLVKKGTITQDEADVLIDEYSDEDIIKDYNKEITLPTIEERIKKLRETPKEKTKKERLIEKINKIKQKKKDESTNTSESLVESIVEEQFETPIPSEEDNEEFKNKETEITELTEWTAISWKSANNPQASSEDKTDQNIALSDFLENNVADVVERVYVEYEVDEKLIKNYNDFKKEGTKFKKAAEVYEKLKSGVKVEDLTEDELNHISEIPIKLNLKWKNTKENVSHKGKDLYMYLHNGEYANFAPTVKDLAKTKLTELKLKIIQGTAKGLTMSSDINDKMSGFVENSAEDINIKEYFPKIPIGEIKLIGSVKGKYVNLNEGKTKVHKPFEEFSNENPGGVYIEAETNNGMIVPVKMNTGYITPQIANIIINIYKDILASKNVETIKKSPISSSIAEEIANLGIVLDDLSYQNALDIFVFSGLKTLSTDKKTVNKGTLYDTRNAKTGKRELVFYSTRDSESKGTGILKNYSLEQLDSNREEVIQALIESKFHQVNYNAVKFKTYREYLINNVLYGRVKIFDTGKVFNSPLVYFNDSMKEEGEITPPNNSNKPKDTEEKDQLEKPKVNSFANTIKHNGISNKLYNKGAKHYSIPTLQAELEWLKQALPQTEVEVLEDLIRVNSQGATASGQFYNNMILISKLGEVGTVYHEAFHKVFQTLLTDKERSDLLKEAYSNSRAKNDKEAEEYLADKFMEYKLAKGNNEPDFNLKYLLKGKQGNFITRLWKLFTNIFNNHSTSTKIFERISRGYYANKKDINTSKTSNRDVVDGFTMKETEEILDSMISFLISPEANTASTIDFEEVKDLKLESIIYNFNYQGAKSYEEGDYDVMYKIIKLLDNFAPKTDESDETSRKVDYKSPFVKLLLERLAEYNIVANREWQEWLDNEDDKMAGFNIKPAFESSSKDNANSNVKLLIASMLKVVDYEDGKYTYDLNTLNIPKVDNATNNWNLLSEKLSNLPLEYDENGVVVDQLKTMKNAIKKLAAINPSFYGLLDKINVLPHYKQTQFYQAFNLTKNNYSTSSVRVNKEDIEFNIGEGNSTSPEADIRSSWNEEFLSNFVVDDKFSKEKAAKAFARITKIKNSIAKAKSEFKKDKTILTKEIKAKYISKISKVYKMLGINIDEKVVKSILKSFNNNNFLISLQNIFNDEEIGIDYIVSEGSNSLKNIAEGKTKRGKGNELINPLINESNILNLAKFTLNFDTAHDENLVVGAEGKKYYVYSLHDYLTRRLKDLLTNKKLIESFKHIPFLQNKKYVKLLLDGNMTNAKLLLFNNLINTSEEKDQGHDLTSISYVDDLANRVNRILQGVFPMFTNADKSRHNDLKLTKQTVSGNAPALGITTNITATLNEKSVQIKHNNNYVTDTLIGYFIDELNDMTVAWNKIFNKDGSLKEGLDTNTEMVEFYHYNKDPHTGKKAFVDSKTGKPLGNVFKSVLFPEITNDPENGIIMKSKKGLPFVFNKDFVLEEDGKFTLHKNLADRVRDRIKDRYDSGVIKMGRELIKQGIFDKDYNPILIDKNIYAKYKGDSDNKLDIFFNIVSDTYFGSIANNIEMTAILYGSLANYKSLTDFMKRAPSTIATGKFLRIFKKDNKWKVRPTYKMTVGENIFKKSEHLNKGLTEVKKQMEKNLDLYDLNFTKEQKKDLIDTAIDYGNVNRTDAQGYVTLDRAIEILNGLGLWKPSYDKFLPALRKGEHFDNSEVKHLLFNPFKGVYYGLDQNGDSLHPTYVKYSGAVLLPALTHNTPLEQLRLSMEAQGIDEYVVSDGVKLGATVKTNIVDENGNIKQADKIKMYGVEMSNLNWRLQQDSHNAGVATRKEGTQHPKNIQANIVQNGKTDAEKYDFNDKKITGNQLVKFINKTRSALSNKGFAKLERQLKLENGRLSQEEGKKILKESALGKERNHNLLEGVSKKLGLPIDAVFSAANISGKVMAKVKKNTVDIDMPGGTFVQLSDFGLQQVEKVGLDDVQKKGITWLVEGVEFKDGVLNYDKNRLKPPRYDVETGKVYSGQFLMPYHIIDSIPGGHDMTMRELNAAIDSRILKAIGYRIPNQGMASIDALECVGILPQSAGDTIVSFAEITQKTGSDFDIDKMYLLTSNFKWNPVTDKLEYIEFTEDEKHLRQRYIDYVKSNLTVSDNEEIRAKVAEVASKSYSAFKGRITIKSSKLHEASKSLLDTTFTMLKENLDRDIVNDLAEHLRELSEYKLSSYDKAVDLYDFIEDKYIQSISTQEYLVTNNAALDDINKATRKTEILNAMVEDISTALESINKLAEDKDTYKDSISFKMKEKRAAIRKDIVENSQFPNMLSIDEFAKLPIEEQNSEKALQNRQLELYSSILLDPKTFIRLITTIDGEDLSKDANKVKELVGDKFKQVTGIDFFGVVNQLKEKVKMLAGKAGVGQVANYMTFFGLTQHAKDSKGLPLRLAINLGRGNTVSTEEGKQTSFNQILDENNNFISDVITWYANGFLDLAKDPFMYYINMNTVTTPIAMMMLSAGVSYKFVNRFLVQPAIVDLIEATDNYDGTLNTNERFPKDSVKKGAVIKPMEKIRMKYGLSISELNVELGGLDLSTVSKKELENQFAQPTKTKQLQYLEMFETLQTYSKEYAKAIRAAKADTQGGGKNFTNRKQKEVLQKQLMNSDLILGFEGLFDETALDTFHKNSVVKTKNIGKDVSILESNVVQNKVDTIFRNIGKGELDTVSKELIYSKLLKEMYSYLIAGADFFDISFSEKMKLMIGDNSIAKRLKKLQKSNDKTISDNLLISSLKFSINKSLGDYVFINNFKSIPTSLENNLYMEWEKLLTHPQENVRIFARDLIKYAFISSGMNKTSKSIYHLIPSTIIPKNLNDPSLGINYADEGLSMDEYFERKLAEYADTSDTNMSNAHELDNFVYDQVYRNNVANNDIVPIVSKAIANTLTVNGKKIDKNVAFIVNDKAASHLITGKTIKEEVQFRPFVKRKIYDGHIKDKSYLLLYKLRGYKIVDDMQYAVYVRTQATGIDVKGKVIKDYSYNKDRSGFNYKDGKLLTASIAPENRISPTIVKKIKAVESSLNLIEVKDVVVNDTTVNKKIKLNDTENKYNSSSENPSDFTNHSGGALGADSMFDEIGRKYGFNNHNHYYFNKITPKGNLELTDNQILEGIQKAKEASVGLGRSFIEKYSNLLGRNWFQIKNSTQVIAIAPIVNPGELNSKGYKVNSKYQIVDGGTGWAVQMAINSNKEVNVFNLKDNNWYKWNYKTNTFEKSNIPVLHINYAGIGSRQDNGKMSKESVKAIEDVYKKAKNKSNNNSTTKTSTVDNTNSKRENITSEGSEFAKLLTNPGNNLSVEYKGKTFRNAEHAYQTWKSGEFNDKAYQEGLDGKFKPTGGNQNKTNKATSYQTMVDIITAKLEQHPELIKGINERGGINYLDNSTHEGFRDKFWEGVNGGFMKALKEAYNKVEAYQDGFTENELNRGKKIKNDSKKEC